MGHDGERLTCLLVWYEGFTPERGLARHPGTVRRLCRQRIEHGLRGDDERQSVADDERQPAPGERRHMERVRGDGVAVTAGDRARH
jgi:hypothetical protein